ncbi:MAG: class I SAM-dependent methyltransferase [Limnohabitans sp.]|nr:class I SAM-dependent methyltransferase [Burkholderiales bacterium]
MPIFFKSPAGNRCTACAVVLCLSVLTGFLGGCAVEPQAAYKPQRGQAGKDVVWIASRDDLISRMLDAAKVSADDLVYDLGAGDGNIAIAAAKQYGARAVGIEYNEKLAKLAQANAERAGVAQRVKIIQGDIFREDFSSATVVTLYLLEELNAKLRPLVLKMKPGTRVVSNNFSMGDWEPDQVIEWSGQTAYLWRVPALVHGHWTLTGLSQLPAEKEHTIYLEQRFQRLSGTLTTGGKTQALLGARIDGDILHFSFLNARGELQPVKALVQGDQWRGELVGPYGMVELAQPPAPISAKRNAP